MADDFGLKIGVEGEREFKKALSDINQSFKVLGSEMTLVTSMFDKQDRFSASADAALDDEILVDGVSKLRVCGKRSTQMAMGRQEKLKVHIFFHFYS